MRVADNPPSQEQLFLLDYARHNASVGEDMRDKLVAVELITEAGGGCPVLHPA